MKELRAVTMVDQIALDLEALRRYKTNPSQFFAHDKCSRIEEVAEIRTNSDDDSSLITSEDEDEFLRECVFQLEGKFKEIVEEYSDASSLEAEDLDAYLESLKGQNWCMETEIENLMKGCLEDCIRLQNNIEGLTSSMDFIQSQSQGLETKRGDAPLELAEHEPETAGGCKFKLLDVNSEIEKKRGMLRTIQHLDYTLKRCEGVINIEDMLTGLKVIEFEGNRITLSLTTFIPELELEQNHELAIQFEFLDATLQLKKAEIFPNDVYIGQIIDASKSFKHFVPRVQDRIVLSTLRKSLVKDANKSRHSSIEYIERDEMIVCHMVEDGVDAFIKPTQGWPIAISPLKLLSLKPSTQSSKDLSFSFLCKVEEMVSSLDVKVCQNLSTFMDALENIFKQRMRIQLQLNT